MWVSHWRDPFAASERSDRAATLIWPSRTGHLYIAVSILDFFLARDISFYEYVLPDVLSVWSLGI